MDSRPAGESSIDQASADVLARARHAVQERRRADVVRAAAGLLPWIWAFAGITLALVAGVVLWPAGTLAGRLQTIVQGVCDQRHNIEIGGTTLPLDARCTGIYTGFLAALVYSLVRGRSRTASMPATTIAGVLAAAIILMGLDGFNSLLYESGAYHLYRFRWGVLSQGRGEPCDGALEEANVGTAMPRSRRASGRPKRGRGGEQLGGSRCKPRYRGRRTRCAGCA